MIIMDIETDKYKKDNFFASPLAIRSDDNFFASSSNIVVKEKKHTISNRINDFDSNILENNAYQDIPDEMLKIEHKISILEKALIKISGEANALSGFGEISQIKENEERKKMVEKELAELKKKYSELGLSAKISGQITSVVSFTSNKKNSIFSRTKDFIVNKILAKISKKISSNLEMKATLEKLSSINSNVDELINMQVPYGETIGRYERLTNYLNKANVIHSQISKNLKGPKEFLA